MNDINGNKIEHPSYLKLNTGDVVFTVLGKDKISFYGEKLGKIEILNEENINKYKITLLDRVQIKSNEKIFHEFQSVSKSISSLGGIVQNDITADKDLITEWENILDEAILHLKKLKIETKNYISNNSKS